MRRSTILESETTNLDVLFKQLGKQKTELDKFDYTVNKTEETIQSTTHLPQRTNYNPAIDEDLWLSGMMMGFSLVLVGFMTYLIKNGTEIEDFLKVFGTILIVVSAVFLIVADYSEKQIAAVIGLLGTIVGYILGKQHYDRTNSPIKPIQTIPKIETSDG